MTGRYVTQKVSNFWKPMLSHNSFFYRKQSLLPPCYALSNVKYFDAFSRISNCRTKRSLQQQYVVWGCTHLWELLTQRKLRTVSTHHIIEIISYKHQNSRNWDFHFIHANWHLISNFQRSVFYHLFPTKKHKRHTPRLLICIWKFVRVAPSCMWTLISQAGVSN